MEEQAVLLKTKSELHSMSLKEIFFKYVRYLPLFVVSVALALFIAFGYLRYATEIYRASGMLLIKDEKSSPASSTDKIDVLMQSQSHKNIQTEIEIIQSRALMERVVKASNLNFTYHAVGKIKEIDVYGAVPFRVDAIAISDSSAVFTLPIHFRDQETFQINAEPAVYRMGDAFTTKHGRFRLIRTKKENVGIDYKVTWSPASVRAGALLGGVVVVPKQSTGIVTVAAEATSPYLAADLVNGLIAQYQTVTIEDKNAITQQKIDFIDKELDSVSRQYDSISRLYANFRLQNNVISPEVQSENYLARVEEADKSLREQKLLVENVRQLEDYLRNRGGSVPSSLGVSDPTLNALVEQYNKAQLERNELLNNAPEGNVVVQQKTEEVETLRRKILENTQNVRRSFGTAVGSLQSTNSQAMAQIRTIPSKEREALDIQRNLQTKLQIYNVLLGKREESAIELASTISNTKVVQAAVPETWPIKPNRRSTQLLAVVIGLLVPTCVIVLLELFNDRVSSRQDIERLTKATIIGEVGHNFSKETLLVTTGNRKAIAEQFRILRSNLQYFLVNVEKPVLLITSSFSGEGKSFISTNVGAVMALANKRTIVLEFDIRKPKILSGLGLGKRPGLTNYLLGQAKVEDLPLPVPGAENLYVLPCGPIPPNPSELLLEPKLNDLFVYLKANFDVVVMDTAPVGMVSDALTLSKFADCTLYIVRQGHTYKKQIGMVDEYYENAKLPKLSIVLNDVKLRAGYGYGYGYGGYGYGYGSGYFEEEESPRSGFDKWFGWLGFKNGAGSKTKKKKAKAS